MRYENDHVKDLQIAYIGGGSRGWAWGLMSDLVSAADISGTVRLYDIDKAAAAANVIIGEKFNGAEGARSHWNYLAADSLSEALSGADFVVISILPGTFDEMESDVHTPEKYGIYQSVGDTAGPGGIVRALRAIPMFEEIGKAIAVHCPRAWVINYTNPMTVLVRTLYRVFPRIKAFGCCHEVFGTQKLLSAIVADHYGVEQPNREEIKVSVTGVNHFTWLTSAQYRNVDLFPLYRAYAEKFAESGFNIPGSHDDNWMNSVFSCNHRVKFDLFLRYGAIAAAGDRHLAEFCDGHQYLESPQKAKEWHFGLTPVSWRKSDLQKRLEKSRRRISGEDEVKLRPTGEDGVNQIRALLGLHTMVTNVNLPNVGQIPDLPLGAVVETNAVFTSDSVTPVMAGNLPDAIRPLISRTVAEQEKVVEAALTRDLDLAFEAFSADPLVTVDNATAKALFDEMIEKTKAYLPMYKKKER